MGGTGSLQLRGRRRARGVLLGLAGLAAAGGFASPALAITPEEFLQLPAIDAFKEGRFQDAIEGLEALPIAGPDDAIILRYIALAHQQLGDHRAALAALDEGLAVAPDNAALHYFRAVSLLELGEDAAAQQALNRVRTLAPDSLYAQQALNLSQTLQGLTDDVAPEDRGWTARLEAGVQYDGNIPAAPDGFGSETGGFRTFERATGTARLWQSGPWSLDADADVYYSQHLDNEFRDFDTIIGTLGAELAHLTSIGDTPVSFGAGYHFEATWVGYESYSQVHRVDLTGLAAFTDDSLTQIRLSMEFGEFDDEGVLPTVTSRDGIEHSAGLTQYLFIDGRESYVFAGYAFGLNLADGSNFDRTSHLVSVGGSTRIFEEIRLDAGLTYLHEDYPDFVGPIQRRTDRFDLTFGAAKEIFDNTELSASWTYIDENSSIDVLSFDQHVGTVSMILSF
ncbi:MAG: tetratricopeptide repeat protein [Alphaproteobacteria bacterium]